ncbi:hypothetical protein [Luteibacter jiangsuensis]
MKSKNPFSIINRPVELEESRDKLKSSVGSALKKQSKGARVSLDKIPPALVEALVSTSERAKLQPRLNSAKAQKAHRVPSDLPGPLLKAAKRAISGTPVATIGILDLGAWVSRIPKLLRVMNASQDRLIFLELQTPVPAGLIKTKQPLMLWAAEQLGRSLTPSEKKDLMRNMLANEFYYFADAVRLQNKLDVLIGLTSAMIAFTDEDGPKWNYYAAGEEQVSLVSTCDLREFSEMAGRPYEAAIGMLVATQVFALRNGMQYHDETRGCIFDFNENRIDLVKSIRGMQIDADCINHFKDKDEAKVARDLISSLARMKDVRRD